MLLKWVSCVLNKNTFILILNKLEKFDLKQTRKNKNPGKNFFALNDTHYNDINRYHRPLTNIADL